MSRMLKIFAALLSAFLTFAAVAQVTVTTPDGTTYNLSGTLTATLAASQPTGTEFTPTMTGPTTGQWTASATSEYTESGSIASAWRALTPGNAATWTDKWSSAATATAGAPQTWSLQSSSPFQVSSIHLISRPDSAALEALTFQIIDMTSGAVLASATSLSWSPGEEKSFAIPTTLTQNLGIRITSCGALCQFKVRLFS